VIYQVSKAKETTGFSPGYWSKESEMKEMLISTQGQKKARKLGLAGEDMRRDKAGSQHALPL
jgi:hypothetical protein